MQPKKIMSLYAKILWKLMSIIDYVEIKECANQVLFLCKSYTILCNLSTIFCNMYNTYVLVRQQKPISVSGYGQI